MVAIIKHKRQVTKEEPEEEVEVKSMFFHRFCPYCGKSFGNPHNISSIREYSKKTTFCTRCFNRVEWDGRRWVKADKKWYE